MDILNVFITVSLMLFLLVDVICILVTMYCIVRLLIKLPMIIADYIVDNFL